MDAWAQALYECERKDANNVDQYIHINDSRLELYRDPAQMTEYLTQHFVTCTVVQDTIAAGMQKLITDSDALSFPALVWDKQIGALQVTYDATKERVETSLLNLEEEVIVNTIHQRKMDYMLMSSVEALTKSGGSIENFAQRGIGCQWLIAPTMAHKRRHIEKLKENSVW